jgi:uncharacterized protein
MLAFRTNWVHPYLSVNGWSLNTRSFKKVITPYEVIGMKTVTKAPIATFFILAYLISWFFWLPLIFVGEDPGIFFMLLWVLGGFGPFVAAIITSKLAGVFKDFTKLLFMWRVSFKWYLVALGLPVLIAVVAYGVFLMAGGTPPAALETPPLYLYPLLLLFVMILGGGLEEPGWRGFALPMLLKRHNPFLASMLIGIGWAFWHLPLFFAPLSSQFNLPFEWYFLNTLAFSIMFTWLFLKSNRSTVTAIVLHGGINAVFTWYPGLSNISTSLGTLHYYAPITVASWLIAGLLLIVGRRQFFTSGDTPA